MNLTGWFTIKNKRKLLNAKSQNSVRALLRKKSSNQKFGDDNDIYRDAQDKKKKESMRKNLQRSQTALLDDEDVNQINFQRTLSNHKQDKFESLATKTRKLSQSTKRNTSRTIVEEDEEESEEPPDLVKMSKQGSSAETEQQKQTLMQQQESLDQDRTRNEPYFRMQGKWHQEYEYYFYIQLTLLGIIVALSGFFLDYLNHQLWNLKQLIIEMKLVKTLSLERDWKELLGFLGVSVAQGLVACVPIVQWCSAAAGGGIAEVKAQLNGVNINNLTTIKTGVQKLVLTAFAVASGMQVGIEGPMIHVGAVAGVWAANLPGLDTVFPGREFWKRFRNDWSKRDLLSCGAAAGVVAGFLSPIGGLMFVIEEASTFWTLKMTLRTLFISLVCGVGINVLTGLQEETEYFQNLVRFGNFDKMPLVSMQELHWVLGLGVLCGLCGGLWNRLAKVLMHLRVQQIVGQKKQRVCEVLVLCITCVVLRIMIPLMQPTCRPIALDGYRPSYFDVVDPKIENYELASPSLNPLLYEYNLVYQNEFAKDSTHQLTDYRDFSKLQVRWISVNCAPNEQNPLATLFLYSQVGMFKNLFHNQDPFGLDSLGIFILVTFVLVLLLNFTAVPMGLFMPSMMIGAALGRAQAELLREVHGTSLLSLHNPGFQAMVGAAGMVTGVTRLVLTVVVVFQEITDRSTTCIPMLLALVAAKAVADTFSIGIYDLVIELKCIPFVEMTPHYDHTKKIKASQIMREPVVSLMSVERLSKILEVVENQSHNGFPVIRIETGTFRGVITKNVLITLLNENQVFKYKADNQKEVLQQLKVMDESQILDQYSFSKSQESKLTIRSYQFTDTTDFWVDLRNYSQQGALCINQETPIERIFELFRAFGTRHLTICDDYFQVVGIITRKDIMSDQSHNLQ